MTADGTGTAVTPMVLDPGDGTTVTCTSKKNYSAEPTYATGNLAEFALHLRATGIFEPPPGADWTCAIGSGPGSAFAVAQRDREELQRDVHF
jgi:hypothetical protein